MHASPQAAAAELQSLERLLLVTAFSVSAYSGVKRTKKPVNAFLGETFEYACPEKGFRFLAEKASAATFPKSRCCTQQTTHLKQAGASTHLSWRLAWQDAIHFMPVPPRRI